MTEAVKVWPALEVEGWKHGQHCGPLSRSISALYTLEYVTEVL